MMKALLFVVAAAGLTASAALGAARTPLQSLDYFKTQIALDPELSPDGRHVIYTRAGRDIVADRQTGTLWIAALDGSFDRQLTGGAQAGGFRSLNNDSGGGAKWSPDGGRIAFVGPSGGSQQILVRDMATGKDTVISRLPRKPSRLAWSPDGRTIAFLMPIDEPIPTIKIPEPPIGGKWRGRPFVTDAIVYRYDGGGSARPVRYQLFTIAAAGGQHKQLSGEDVSFGGYGGWTTTQGYPSWTPDGRHIVISGRPVAKGPLEPDDFRYSMQTDVYSYDAETGAQTRLTNSPGFKNKAEVSPDGKQIAYVGFPYQGRFYHTPNIWVMNLDGSNARAVTAKMDRPMEDFAWSPDGKSLLVTYEDTGRCKLARIDLSGKVEVLADNVGAGNNQNLAGGASVSASASGGIAYSIQDETTPGDIVVRQNGRVRRVTRLNDSLFAQRELGTTEERWFASSHDGKKIEAFVIKPPRFDPTKRYPMVLYIHGGPSAAFGRHYDYENQMYAAAGYVVLLVNPRGSSGYGVAFNDEIENNFPGDGDAADLLSGVDSMVKESWIDSSRLYVAGGSAGGVLTSWLLGRTTRFRAAATLYGVFDWAVFALTSDEPQHVTTGWFKTVPFGEGRDEYWRRSTLRLAENVSTPTLVMCGEQDWRTPISQSEMWFTALKLHGVKARLIRFPDEGHGTADIPSNRVVKITAILDWFSQHGGMPVPTADATPNPS